MGKVDRNKGNKIMIPKECPLDSKKKFMIVMDAKCTFPFDEEAPQDVKEGWVYGMIDLEHSRLMCQSCPFRIWHYSEYDKPSPTNYPNKLTGWFSKVKK